MIDWSNPGSKISTNFTVHEALWLPSWRKYAEPTTEQRKNIVLMAASMEEVRRFLGKPIVVHCWLRPEAYNTAIGGAPGSAHIEGNAVDFHVKNYEGPDGCNLMRGALYTQLEAFGLRMERNDNGAWIHLDRRPVPEGGRRYFLP